MKPTLSIIGAGRVGCVLGRQFHQDRIFTVCDILNRTMDSSLAACQFIAAGTATDAFAQLRPADIYMIAVPDDQIRACSMKLIDTGRIQPSTLVFHCSGALTAAELGLNANAASLHPMRSFADPAQVAATFQKTIFSIEGDAAATGPLAEALKRSGAEVVAIQSDHKPLYHAAAVFASNYLVTLMDAALITFEAAGISGDLARRLAEPMAQETFNNIFRLGPQRALTGPIARGDVQTVLNHEDALKKWNPELAILYRELANATRAMKSRL